MKDTYVGRVGKVRVKAQEGSGSIEVRVGQANTGLDESETIKLRDLLAEAIRMARQTGP